MRISEADSADLFGATTRLCALLPTYESIDSAMAKVPDMKPKMTTAVNTRRMRGKRWGYEGINARFRGVNKVYPSESLMTRLMRTFVRITMER
jgi:hypothetical protein